MDILGYKNIIKDKNEEDIEKLRHYIALFNKEFIMLLVWLAGFRFIGADNIRHLYYYKFDNLEKWK